MWRSIALLALLGILAPPAWAQIPPGINEACDDTVDVDRFRYYRQLSLDLRGRVPSADELQTVADAEQIDEATIDAMLDGPEFETLVRRHHMDLLWPSTEFLDVINVAVNFLLPAQGYDAVGDPNRLWVIFVGFFQRGGLVPCKDEPAEYDDNGDLVFEAMPDGTQREGWVMVAPYWAPDTEVKVCAAEASLVPAATNGAACDTWQGMTTGTCGCGPALERCAGIPVVLDITAALREQLLLMITRPILGDRPYTELLTTQTEPINGPLVHYYRTLAPLVVDPAIMVPPVAPEDLPDVPYTDATWYDRQRTAPVHSGVLTSMSYLLRFQTDRSRANRFYDAFFCSAFVAPPTGLPSPADPCSQEPNLRERCGCKDCHITLEPAAAAWGRFANAGTLYLDPEVYPAYLPRCAACAQNPDIACDDFCNRFYVSEIGHPKQVPFAGVLKPFEFKTEDEIARMEAGPSRLVQDGLDNHRLPTCVSQRLFERLYKRTPTATERRDHLSRFTAAFEASDYNFKTLVKTMVTDAAYRRMVR
jgi:hypothetical protein